MKKPIIGIVIPIVQSKYVFDLIKQIEKTTNEKNYAICIVNDGNLNIKHYLLKHLPSTIELLNLKNNLCFAGANNAGWEFLINKHPSIQYLCTINDDTIPNNNWLDHLKDCLKKNPTVAACSPIMIIRKGFFKNKNQYYSTWKFGDINNPMVLDKKNIKVDSYVSVLAGFCLIIKKEALLQVEYFDERYKNSCEDIDLSLKLQKKKWNLMVCSNSYVIHKAGKSRFKSKMNTNITQSRKLFFSKWGTDLSKYNLK